MQTLFVKQLTVIDASFLDANAGIVGESWLVDLYLTGELDHQGMILDFGAIKKQVKQFIDESLDHRFIIPTELAGVELNQQEEQWTLNWRYPNGARIKYEAPASALALVPASGIDATQLQHYLTQRLMEIMPPNVASLALNLYHEQHSGPYYRYSHGLKKHDGNCQRMIHGHRSALQISQGEQRLNEEEHAWCTRWQDIYLGTREDMTRQWQESGVDYTQFAYRTDQGYFLLELPTEHCDFLDTDSTVEWIAQHILDRVNAASPLQVMAFEGVNKGAIAKR